MSFAWASQSKSSKIPRRLLAAPSLSSPISTPPQYNNTSHAASTASLQLPTPVSTLPSAECANHANHAQHNRRVTRSRVPRLSGGATSGSLYLAAHPSVHGSKSHVEEQCLHDQHSPKSVSPKLATPNSDRLEHDVLQQRSADSTPISVAHTCIQDAQDEHTSTTDQALQSAASTPSASALKPLRLSASFDKPDDHSSALRDKNERPRLMRPKTFSVSMTRYDTPSSPTLAQSFSISRSSSNSRVGEDVATSPDAFSTALSSFMRTSSFSHTHSSITSSAPPASAPAYSTSSSASAPASSTSSPTPLATPSPPTLSRSFSSPSSHNPTFTLTSTPAHTPHTPHHALPFLHARATETRHVLAALESSIASILHMSNDHDKMLGNHKYVQAEEMSGGSDREDGYSAYV